MRSRWLVLLLLTGLVGACARTTLKSSVVDEHGGTDEFAEMDFWDGLALQHAVSNNDGLHALLLTFGGDAGKDYAARLAEAKKRGWINESKQPAANETIRTGVVARAVCKEAGIKGGLTMRVLGTGERYAVNELNYRGWLPSMSPNQSISGQRLITLLNQVADTNEADQNRPREELAKAEAEDKQ